MKTITDKTAIFLSEFLSETEAIFDRDPTELSPEIMHTYIEAAKHLAKDFGRTNNRVKEIWQYMVELEII